MRGIGPRSAQHPLCHARTHRRRRWPWGCRGPVRDHRTKLADHHLPRPHADPHAGVNGRRAPQGRSWALACARRWAPRRLRWGAGARPRASWPPEAASTRVPVAGEGAWAPPCQPQGLSAIAQECHPSRTVCGNSGLPAACRRRSRAGGLGYDARRSVGGGRRAPIATSADPPRPDPDAQRRRLDTTCWRAQGGHRATHLHVLGAVSPGHGDPPSWLPTAAGTCRRPPESDGFPQSGLPSPGRPIQSSGRRRATIRPSRAR